MLRVRSRAQCITATSTCLPLSPSRELCSGLVADVTPANRGQITLHFDAYTTRKPFRTPSAKRSSLLDVPRREQLSGYTMFETFRISITFGVGE